MIFLDYSVFCTDVMTPSFNPTVPSKIDSIKLENGAYDDLYVTKNNSMAISSNIPDNWDFSTILHAKFNGGVIAGNVDFILNSVNGALLMRRETDSFDWLILDHYDINKASDFGIIFQDRTAAIGKTYEYSLTPIINGILGNYNKTIVKSESDKLVIIDSDEIWTTSITDGFLDTTRTYPSTPVQTLYNKYPTIVRNTVTNFDTINVSGTWIPSELTPKCGEKMIDINDSDNFPYITSYAKQFIDFLTNGKPKIIKASDARMWLVWINDSISDAADQVFMCRKISFTATEIGDVKNNNDLYNAGFLPEDILEWL